MNKVIYLEKIKNLFNEADIKKIEIDSSLKIYHTGILNKYNSDIHNEIFVASFQYYFYAYNNHAIYYSRINKTIISLLCSKDKVKIMLGLNLLC